MDIDLVYLWVDGNDPKWRAKRDTYVGKPSGKEANCKGRFSDNGELRYSLRSVEKYAPWIRRIFIVTDDQTPQWLDTSHPKIQIVDHTEIMPKESLPCFSSRIIEHHLYRIPGLAEHFLYSNDDMFINKEVSPSTFFADDGLPIIRLSYRRPFRKWAVFFEQKILRRELSNYYSKGIHNAALLVEREFGKYYGGKGHHNIDAYLRSDFQKTREMFDKEIGATLTNHVRSDNDIQRHLYSYVALAQKRGHARYVTLRTSFRLHINKKKRYEQFFKCDPMLFCMNDSQNATDEDRRRVAVFLESLFPNKSQFEK